MELPHIGETCEICKRTDFLPFRCIYCDKLVCTEHRNNHGSDCPLKKQPETSEENRPEWTKLLKLTCDHCRQPTLELELVQCPNCQNRHCLAHRHNHNCSKVIELESTLKHKEELEQKGRKNEDILNRLKKYGPAGVEPKVGKDVAAKNQQLAKRIRIMKIKQSARGPPNVPLTNRLHFHVVYQPKDDNSVDAAHGEPKSAQSKQLNVYTSTAMSLGRLIDWIADQMVLTNRNNTLNNDQLVLRHVTTKIVFDTQKTFGDLVKEGTIEDGDDITITYVKPEV